MDAPDLLSLNRVECLSDADRKVYQFVTQRYLLQPQQLVLALKVQRQSCGPLAMVLWQLGFIGLPELAQLWDQ